MKTRWNGRRFLAALLAFVLTFTSLGLDGISAYAEEPNQIKPICLNNCDVTNGKIEIQVDGKDAVEMTNGEGNGVDVSGAESIYLTLTPNDGYSAFVDAATVRVNGEANPSYRLTDFVGTGLPSGTYDLSALKNCHAEIENIEFRSNSGGQPNNEVVIYKDASCETPFQGDEKAYTGDTVYAKVREGSEDGFEIIGWAKGNEFSWPQDSEPAGYNTDSKDGFTYSYEDGVASLTIPYDYYNNDILFIGMISHGEGNDEYHDSRLYVNQSLKGLVLCDNGNPYDNEGLRFVYGGFPQYRKDAGACVYDSKCFALALSSRDELVAEDNNVDGITLLEGTDNLTLERLVGGEFEAYRGMFGYRAEHRTADEEDSGVYYAHYYLQVYDEGTYRLSYNGVGVDTDHNFVLFNVGLPRIALFCDEYAGMLFAGEQIFFNEGNTEATYYLHLDADEELGFENLGVTIWENGDEKNYSYAGNGTFKEGENSADLSKYFTFEDTADDFTFKVTFKEGDYDIDFSADFLYPDWDNTDPRRDHDGRHYYARTSMEGKLGMLDWLELAWDEKGEFDYDSFRAGDDARYNSDVSWEVTVGAPRYFLLGIYTDMNGENADMLEGATIKVYRDNNGNWEDVTDSMEAGYAGVPDSQNPVARGLYKVNTSEPGEYKLVATKDGKDYEFFYRITLPTVALYEITSDDPAEQSFDMSSIKFGEIFQIPYALEEHHYYLYAHSFDQDVDATVSEIEINWPDWWVGPDQSTRFEYDSASKTFKYKEGFVPEGYEENHDGILGSVCEIEQINESLYDFFPYPNGCEYRFFATYKNPYDENRDEERENRYFVSMSQKGLTLCDEGDAYIDNKGDGGFKLVAEDGIHLTKSTGIGVYDEKRFSLYINPNDSYDFRGDEPDVTEIIDNLDKFTVKKLVDDKYVAISDDQYEFGYRYEHREADSENRDRYVAHYYFRAFSSGDYRLYYSDLAGDINYVDINVSLCRVSLYTDGTTFDDSTVYSDYDIMNDGTTAYYLHFMVDEGWNTDGYYVMVHDEKGEHEYKYVNGKFYEVTYDEDNEEIATKATDLSAYFAVTKVDNCTYKFVFAEKEYNIRFGQRFCADWNDDIKMYEHEEWEDRSFGIRTSLKGKLAVLDLIEGWEGAWEEGGILNHEALYPGSNEGGPATFHTDMGLWLADGEYNLVLGVVTDDFGEKADALTDAADVKMSKYDASKKTWKDVTEAARLTYIGKADSENFVAQGLWSFVPYTAGKFRLEAKANEKTLYLEFDITLPHVGMYSSNKTLNESTIVLHDLYNQIDAGDKSTSYYLYGYDFDAKIAGTLSKVEIYDWNGEPTSYALQDGSFYEINAEGTISDVPTDLSDVFKLEKDSSKAGLFKLTPWPNDYEVAFTFSFDYGNEDIRKETNSYHFNISQKGLVINGCVEEAAPGVWSSKLSKGAEYDYGKFYDLCVGDTGYFALAVNKNDAWPSEEKHDLTRLSAATGITLYKVVDGKNEAAGKSAAFKYSMNSVFEFTAYEAGEYRLVYTDGTYVTITVNEPGAAFYRGEVTGNDYNFNDANLLKDGDISLTAEEAATGELVFYAVVDERAIDGDRTPVVFIDQDIWSDADVNHTTLYYSAHPEWVSTAGGFAVETITGKNISINGREANGSLVYKITVNRDEYYGLSEREFYLMFMNANGDDMDVITENGEAIFGMDGWENASFRLTPADISKAEVVAFAGLPTEMRLNADESIVRVENLEENLQIKFGEYVLTNPSQYNIIYTTQRTYPGTVKFLVEGIRDFAGTVEGSFEIGKLNIANIAFFDGYIYYDSVTKSVVAEACSYYGIINPPAEKSGSLVKNGVDYKITLVEDITEDSPSGRYNIKVSALEGSKYLTGEKTVEADYDKESNFSMEVNYGTSSERYTYIYDGTEKVPAPEIWGCGGILKEGVDYDIVKPTGGAIDVNAEYEDNYKFTAVGKGWFAGQSVEVVVHISPADIAAAKVTGLPKSITSGDEIPAVVLTWNGKELVKDTDYTVTMNNVTVGTGTLTIEGIGNFTGKIEKTVTVKADTTITSKNARISPKDSDKKYVYPEVPQATDFVVEMKNASGTFAPMAEGTYAITVTQADKAGNAVITATGNAEAGYAGTISTKVAIAKAVLDKNSISFTCDEAVTYSPDGNYFDFETAVGPIEYGVDFTAKYSANKAGTQTVTFTGIGNYTGEVSYEFTVNKFDLSTNPAVQIRNTKGNTTIFYTQKVGDKVDFSTKDVILTYLGEVDFPATDYEVKCDAKELVSTSEDVYASYEFTITGIGDNCEGTYEYVISVAVTPEKTDISDFKVVLDPENPEADTFVFTGNNLLYEDFVKVFDKDDNPLVESMDYTVSLTDAVNAGKQKATIVGIGNYKGVITKTYTIKPVKVTDETSDINIYGTNYDFRINENGKVDFGEITDIYYKGMPLPKDSYTYSFKAPKVAPDELVELTVKYKGNLTGKVTYKGDALCNVMGCQPTIIGIMLSSHGGDYTITGTDTYTYTGKAITPKVTVKVGGKKLTANKDYTLEFKRQGAGSDYAHSMTEAGTYYLKIVGCGKYCEWIEDATFPITIYPASIAKAKVTLVKSSYDFVKDISGNEEGFGEVKEVKLGKKVLTEGVDYSVYFEDNMKPGTAYAIVQGEGNYSNIATKTFTINGKVDINDAAINVDVETVAQYNASKTGAVPELYVYYNGKMLEQGKDYKLVLSNNKNVSGEGEKATVTIKGTGKYTGTYDTVYPFTVIKRFVEESDPDVVLANAKTIHAAGDEDYLYEYGYDIAYNAAGTTYNGKAQSIDPKVKVDGNALKLGKDYEVHYLNAEEFSTAPLDSPYVDWSLYPTSVVNAGDYFAIITFKGNYEGMTFFPYIVAPMNIAKASIKTNLVTFDGHDPSNIVKSVKVGKSTLTEYEDFQVNYKGCPNKNDYDEPYEAFGGLAFADRNEIKKVLKLDIPYTVEDYNLDSLDWHGAGKHTAFVVGKGNYTGYKNVTWSYTGADIKNLKVTVSSNPIYYSYRGGNTPIITAGYTDAQGVYHELSQDIEFFAEYSWGSFDNGDYPKAGKQTITVTSTYFKGSKKFTYTVLPRDFDENSIARDAITINVNDAQYNPKGAKPAVTIDNEWDYAPLVAGKDYTVTYKNNKKAGTATAVVKFKGNYKGTIEKTFEINSVRIYECKASFKTGKTWKPTITIKDPSGSKLKENTDYTVEYTYKQDTYVKNGKNTILRYAGDTVDTKDVLPAGTEIKMSIDGIGNYSTTLKVNYIYNGKNSLFMATEN